MAFNQTEKQEKEYLKQIISFLKKVIGNTDASVKDHVDTLAEYKDYIWSNKDIDPHEIRSMRESILNHFALGESVINKRKRLTKILAIPYFGRIDFLEKKNFMEKCYDFEKKRGIERIVKAVTNSMKVNDDDSLIVQYIKEHTPENAVVFLTGIGKCYPILRSHKVLNNLHQAFVRCPVVMFFPGTYNEQELILFNEIKDDNYYRAFRLVK